MSLQLTLARADARMAGERWHDHFHLCPPCQRWVTRRLGSGCTVGQQLRQQHRETAETLKYEQEAERQPSPDQEALW